MAPSPTLSMDGQPISEGNIYANMSLNKPAESAVKNMDGAPIDSSNVYAQMSLSPTSSQTTMKDVGKSFAGGVGTGLGGIVDALNPINALKDLGKDTEAIVTGDLSKSAPASGMSTPAMRKMASLYTPQTKPGQYAFAAGTGVGGGVAGGPSAMLAGGTSGLVSQAAGDLTTLAGDTATDITSDPKYADFAKKARPLVEATAGLATGGKVIDWLKSPEKAPETFSGPSSIPELATQARDILVGQHDIAKGQETAAWNKVDKQAATQSIPYAEIPKIQGVLMDAQAASGHPILGTQLTTLNRFVDGGLDVPATTVLTMRRALSKASTMDGGLREAVTGLDNILGDNLKIKALPNALAASRERFGKFADQSAVAKTIATDTTPETAGRVLMSDKAQGADVFDQVIKAAGDQAPQAKQIMQQGIVHNIIQDARKTRNDEGVPLLSKDALANNILNLKEDNPSLWGKLEDNQQSQLLGLAREARKGGGNIVKKVISMVADYTPLGHSVRAVENAMGANEVLRGSDQITLTKALDILGRRPEKMFEGWQEHLSNLAGSLKNMPAQAQPQPPQQEDGTQGPPQINLQPANMGPDGVGQPVAPQVPAQPQKDPVDKFVSKVISVESGGRNVGNSSSSASGPAQFTNRTWLSMMKRYAPDIAGRASIPDQLQLRADADFSKYMTKNLASENGKVLDNFGLSPSNTNLYLAHFLGAGDAVKLLLADDNTPVNRLLNKGVILSNQKVLGGKTVAQVIKWAKKKMEA